MGIIISLQSDKIVEGSKAVKLKRKTCNKQEDRITSINPMFHFYTPKNVSKPKVFWLFQGV